MIRLLLGGDQGRGPRFLGQLRFSRRRVGSLFLPPVCLTAWGKKLRLVQYPVELLYSIGTTFIGEGSEIGVPRNRWSSSSSSHPWPGLA